jgi:hypothetical protein
MRSRTVKSEVIPEDKFLINVLYICEVNNCGYNREYSNKQSDQIRSQQLITVAETKHATIYSMRGSLNMFSDMRSYKTCQ